jgi:peptidyl-prolyl cis-trans isomerase C
MKTRLATLALLATLTPFAHGNTGATDDMTTFAVVNGVKIPAVHANFARQARSNRGAPAETLTDEAIREAVIAAELLSQEAVRRGLDKNARVLAAIDYQRRELLSQALIEDFLRSNPLPEEAVRAEYEQAKARAGDKEYRVSHILVETEKEARDIIASLTTAKRKARFEDVARKQSKDSSAGNGGDLGWTVPANLVPEFADAMVKLGKGQISTTPVRSRFGWHVIQVNDVRDLAFPPYDELKNRIASQIQQARLRRFVAELRATAKIE